MFILMTTIFVLLIVARTFFFLIQVEGWSMSPTYLPGDRLLALRYFPRRWLSRGRIVVWKLPSGLPMSSMANTMRTQLYIKRVVGLPGDEVIAPVVKLPEAGEAAEQMVDGQELRTWHIPAGHCFVKGDSPGFDSTMFGPLPLHALKGIILIRLPRRMKTVEEPYFVDSISPPQKES
ncbi:MAG: signal peptidase I [Anaerolineales bacterium]|nr:signal peptidase I [Anaerolineales bacterium]